MRAEIDVERWRAEFPIVFETVCMISNSLGAMPARARDDLAEYAEVWATRGVRAPPGRLRPRRTVRLGGELSL